MTATPPPSAPSIVRWCVNDACARCRTHLLYVPPGWSGACPSCDQPTELVPTDGTGCPNPFCGYEGDTVTLGYCPTCCLTFPEAWAMRGAGSATPCYCGDPRDEHARGVGACLMVRDGVRCGCGMFENPATAGTSVPVHLLPATAPEPAWQWPALDTDGPHCEHGRGRGQWCPDCPEGCTCTQPEPDIDCAEHGDGRREERADPLPGPDPDLPDDGSAAVVAAVEQWGDLIVTELREALGHGIPLPSGDGLYPGSIAEIEDTLGRIERILAARQPSLLLTVARCAVVLVTGCTFVTFLWLLLGASTLAGVVP